MEGVAAKMSKTAALLAGLLSRQIREAPFPPISATNATVCPNLLVSAKTTHPGQRSLPVERYSNGFPKQPRMPLRPLRSAAALHLLGGQEFPSTRHLLALRPACMRSEPAPNNIAHCAQAPAAVCDLLCGCTTHLIKLSSNPCAHGGKQFY